MGEKEKVKNRTNGSCCYSRSASFLRSEFNFLVHPAATANEMIVNSNNNNSSRKERREKEEKSSCDRPNRTEEISMILTSVKLSNARLQPRFVSLA